ncbi:MAG TPA: hypothetical protein VHZ55_18845 [Bryobacteraceae bacterium]|nr:hypothetical protein [Bryobacteraceae bacterium]
MNVQSVAASFPSAGPATPTPRKAQADPASDGSGSSFADTLQNALGEHQKSSDPPHSTPKPPPQPKDKAPARPVSPLPSFIKIPAVGDPKDVKTASASAGTAQKQPANSNRLSQSITENKVEKKSAPRPASSNVAVNDVADLSTAALQNGTAPIATEKVISNPPEGETKDTATKQTSELEATASTTGSTATTAAPPGDLALAMNIGGNSSVASATTAAPIASAQANGWLGSVASHVAAVPPVALAETQRKQETDAQSSGGDAGSGETSLATGSGSTASSKETSASAPTDFEAEFNKFRGEAVKSAHVQISDDNNARVDIRMVERGGSLSVSVRSTDSTLTKALGDHATDLTSRLSLDHYKTETWTPSSSKNSSERQGTPYSGGGREQGSSDQRNRQNSKQNQDPEWVQEFENTPGAFQKRINYTWPQ